MEKMPLPHGVFRALCLAGLTALTLPLAHAQWQWIDGTGRKVFSDTAPPVSIPEKNILRRPGHQPSGAIAQPAPTPATPQVATPKLTDVDPQLEAKKKEAEAAEASKKKAEAERIAKARAENCSRAQQSKANLNSGMRLVITNAKGEREIMSDETRKTETRRIDEIIRNDCGPMPAAAPQTPQ